MGIGDVFSEAGGTAEQLFTWQILGTMLGGLMAPYVADLQQISFQANPTMALSPAELADLVARGLMDPVDGENEATESGVSNSRFARQVAARGQTISIPDALEAVRRGLMEVPGGGPGVPTLDAVLARAGVLPEYRPIIAALGIQNPSWSVALQALLQGQTDRATAERLYAEWGGNPDVFQLLFDTEGSAPTPIEAATMANRGVIPWDGTGPDVTSFEQAFLEGPWRNKWEAPYRALAQYYPPPRTITAMVRNGSLTDAQGTKYLLEQGLSAELAAAYVADAHHSNSASDKNLTASQIVALYENHLINETDATNGLELLKYSPDNAKFILRLADIRRAISALNSAVSRVHSLYVGHKLPRQAASDALTSLGISAAQTQDIFASWDIEYAANVKTLTEAQIADAFAYNIMSQEVASAELQTLGYTAFDAWALLSIKNKAPLPGRPA